MGLESRVFAQSVDPHSRVVKDIKFLLGAQLKRSRDTLKGIVQNSVRNAFFVRGELENFPIQQVPKTIMHTQTIARQDVSQTVSRVIRHNAVCGREKQQIASCCGGFDTRCSRTCIVGE